MSEENQKQFRRMIEEAFLANRPDLIEEFATPDFIENEEMPGMPTGLEGVKAFISMMHEAFSDLTYDIQDQVAEGDKIWARVKMRGTHTGDFMGIPATNKSVEIDAIDIVRFEGGKAAEHWGITDAMGLMQQLGAMPEMPSG